MATNYPTYVVNQDWTTFTAHQPGATYGTNPTEYTYAETGFGSIFETIVDGNLTHPTEVPGAVGVEGTGTLASPLDLTAGLTIAVVKGDFYEEAAYATEEASYTLDFSSIYGAPATESALDRRTKFSGSFVSQGVNNVGFRVSSGEVFFTGVYAKNEEGKYVDENGDVLSVVDQTKYYLKGVFEDRSTITLNRTPDSEHASSDFVVGGAFAAEALTDVTAYVFDTDLTVNGWVWVGSEWGVNETADDAVSNYLIVEDSSVTGTTLQVRHVGELTAFDSVFTFADMILRGDASFDNTAISLTALSNVYGENNCTATLSLENGSTLLSASTLKIGKADNTADNDIERAGVLVLNESMIGALYVEDDPETEEIESGIEIVRAGDIAVNQNGTITMDADSKIFATNVTNNGTINITASEDGEDWIDATVFTGTVGEINIDVTDLADWEGVKRVIYAVDGDVDLDNVVISEDGYGKATRKGKVAIAKGVDYTILYVNHDNDEDLQFAKTVTIDYPAEDTDYYVAFNAFSDAGNSLANRKDETTTILLDGTTEGFIAYAGANEDFDGLTFLRYGEEDATYDVSVTMTSEPISTDPDVYANRILTQGFTVGEGVTFSSDRVIQKSGETLIEGTLNIVASQDHIIPSDPTSDFVPSFQVAGGSLLITGALTGEEGNLDVNATNRDEEGDPIPGTMTVDGAFVDLNKLTIGSNATVTLQNMQGEDGPTFGTIQLKTPTAIDFDRPKLVLFDTDVTVTDKFDSRYGTVFMNMGSTLHVAEDEIGGGTFTLSITATATQDAEGNWTYTGELAGDEGFYKLVYAGLSNDVVLSCQVRPDAGSEYVPTQPFLDLNGNPDKQNGEVIGEYIYTSLGGKGLFVMRESIYSDLFVNSEWTSQEYTYGDIVEDGKYFGVNAFTTFTSALVAAQSLNADNVKVTNIHVLDEVPFEDIGWNYEEDVSFLNPDYGILFYNGNEQPVTLLAGNITFKEGIAWLNYSDPQGAEGGLILSPAAGKTFTVGEDAVLMAQHGDIYLNFGRAVGAVINVDGAVLGVADPAVYGDDDYSQISIYGQVNVSATGSLETSKLLWLAAGKTEKADEDDPNNAVVINGLAATANADADAESEWTIDNPQVIASVLMHTSGDVFILNTAVVVNDLFFSRTDDEDFGTDEDKLVSLNTDWKINSNFYVAEDRTGSATFVGGSILVADGDTDNIEADDVIEGDVQLLSEDFTLNLVDTALVAFGDLYNAGTLNIIDSWIDLGETDDPTAGPDVEEDGGNLVNFGTINIINSPDVIETVIDDTVINDTVKNYDTINVYDSVAFDSGILNGLGNEPGNVVLFVDSDELSGGYQIADYDTSKVFATIVGGDVTLKSGVTFDFGQTIEEDEVGATDTPDAYVIGTTTTTLWGGTVIVDDEDATGDDIIVLTDSNTEHALSDNFGGRNNLVVLSGEAMIDIDASDLVVADLTLTDGGMLYMDYSQVLWVKGDLDAPEEEGITALTIDIDGAEDLDGDTLVVAWDGFLENPNYKWVSEWDCYVIHAADELKKGVDPEALHTVDDYYGVTGLYLDASRFAKISVHHEEDWDNGWYQTFADVAGSTCSRVRVLEGTFTGGSYLNGKNATVVGNYTVPEGSIDPDYDPAEEYSDLVFKGALVAGYDVATLDPVDGLPAVLNMKIVEGNTNLTVKADTNAVFNSRVVGGDIVRFATDEERVNFYRVGDTNLTINGGDFDYDHPGTNTARQIIGGLAYVDPNGTALAVLTGDVNLTIAGGEFQGYNVYGGNWAGWSGSTRAAGRSTRIDGSVKLTIDTSAGDIAFNSNAATTAGGGGIYAGSLGQSAITGDVKVTLTGDGTLSGLTLWGGCDGDILLGTGKIESFVDGDRILAFNDFTGGLDFNQIEDFSVVTFEGDNKVIADTAENFAMSESFNKNVTNWDIEAGATVGNFVFDFAGDTLTLSGVSFEDDGWSFLGEGASVANFEGLKVSFGGEAVAAVDGVWMDEDLGFKLDSADWTIAVLDA